MLDFKQIITDSLLSILPDSSFNVSEDSFTAQRITNAILQNIHPLNKQTSFLSFSKIEIYFEGDKIFDSSISSINISKTIDRINEELPEITHTTNAFYDMVMEVFDNNNKRVFTSISEVRISLIKDGFNVSLTNKKYRWDVKEVVDRIADLDLDDLNKLVVPMGNNYRFLGLDIDMDTKPKKVKKSKDVLDPRISTLDLNKRYRTHKDLNALIFQQDTQQDQQQVQTAKQKLGKQVSTQKVSKSIQSLVDKMSYQKAYDTVEEAMRAWDEADPFAQYKYTVDLASKWYGDNLVLVNGFDVIDKIYYAADLTRKIAKLEDDIANSKSRASLTKLKKELEQAKKDLSLLTPQIQDSLKSAKGYDAVLARAKDIENKMDDYIDDYQSNLSEWKAIKGKMEKAGKLIEIMEVLKDKYASSYDLPPLLSRYNTLMETPIPTILDIENMDTVNLDSVYTAWRQSLQEYKQELESFTDSMRQNYDTLAKILAVKAKSKSLF